jgi:hypothetical protein
MAGGEGIAGGDGMAGGDGIVGTMTVPCSPVVAVGSSGDRLTDVGGVVACLDDVAEVDDVVVVVCEREPPPPQPVASEPATTPAASANSAEFESALRAVMSRDLPGDTAAKPN